MVRRPKVVKRRLAKLGAAWLIALFAWSLVAAPSSIGQSVEPPAEPENLAAYFTDADAAPVFGYFNHEALPAPPCSFNLAHAVTDVALPSAASGVAYLTDFGICNGLHGTTTGSSVPTETSARTPGGQPEAEFVLAGGPIGEEEFGRAAAGVSRASATQEGSPRGFAHSYLGNLILFPAAGSPPAPPGTYDPDATFPGGVQGAPTPDPAPQQQMGILSIGSVASTSESIRNSDTVTSIAVAELQGINIGNRTSDNRCTNCFTIDAIRVEAFAETNGTPQSVRSGYRVTMSRACRRSFQGDPELGGPKEEDACLPLENLGQGTESGGLQTFDTKAFNDFFAKPLVMVDEDSDLTIAVRITAGEAGHVDAGRRERTPPGDPCRNYAYPDKTPKAKPIEECEKVGARTGPDRDNGEEARAVGEGIDIDILTLTGTQLIPADEDLDNCFALFDQDLGPLQEPVNEIRGELANETGLSTSCPVPALRQVRSLNLTLGVAAASAIARPIPVLPEIPVGDGTDLGPDLGPDVGADVTPGVDAGPIGGGTGPSVTVTGGVQPGKFALSIDWSSFSIKPWKVGDITKASFVGAIVAGMIWLIRRRLRFGAG